MPRFFVDDLTQDRVVLTGEDAHHLLRVLRSRVGEEQVLCDGTGTDARCTITALEGDRVVLAVQQRIPSRGELPADITLYQALPKGDKLDLITQKAVELGVTRVVPVLTRYCVSRPDDKTMEKKRQRLQKIAAEAAKQAGRGRIPAVESLLTLDAALGEMQKAQAAILFYEQAVTPLGSVLAPRPGSIALMVGPEGGFSQEEAAQAQEAGLHLCTMGPRILRCETAPLYALSAIAYHLEGLMPPGQGEVL